LVPLLAGLVLVVGGSAWKLGALAVLLGVVVTVLSLILWAIPMTVTASLRGERWEFGAYEEAAAKVLGLTYSDLAAELKNGVTIHQIADSKQITESQFRTALIEYVTQLRESPFWTEFIKDLTFDTQPGGAPKDLKAILLRRVQNEPLQWWDESWRKPARG
jgi:hypothetical protein